MTNHEPLPLPDSPPDDGRAARTGLAARCAAIAGFDVAATAIWAMWWSLSSFATDINATHVVTSALGFLSWTFLPCILIASALIVVADVGVRAATGIRSPWNRAVVSTSSTLLAPLVWDLGFCWYYEDFSDFVRSLLVAEAGWIATLQPLWALLITHALYMACDSKTDLTELGRVDASPSEDVGNP